MKTSNKILIAFASALILLPVLGMVVVSATMYKKGNYRDVVDKVENLNTPSKNMFSLPISTSFQSVNVEDAKNAPLNIHFIKDAKFGVKIPNKLKDFISFKVDAMGVLQVIIKDSKGNNGIREYANIYIFSPAVESLAVANANGISISAEADSLSLVVKKSNSISFNHETKLNKVSIKTDDVEYLNFRDENVKSIDLNLHNTNFTSEMKSYEDVSITTSGKCEVNLVGNYNGDETKFTIRNLKLNTNGIAAVKLENIIVTNCSGRLSDETTVQMPAINLNQMYNKK